MDLVTANVAANVQEFVVQPRPIADRQARHEAFEHGLARLGRFVQIAHGHPIPVLAIPSLWAAILPFRIIADAGQAGGPQGRYREYWDRMSFGDLNESAKTRKAVL